MFGKKKNPELEKFATMLEKGIVSLFKEKGEIAFSKPPEKVKKQLIEYNGKMRADGIDKFNNEATYVGAVSYYASGEEQAKKKALGTMVVYVEQTFIPKLMKKLGYPPVDDENEEKMLDSCGTLGNIIAGRFKSEISRAGYVELEMSHFQTYRNSAVAGVDFCPSEFDLYEISFEIDGEKRLVVEMSMGIVPKK